MKALGRRLLLVVAGYVAAAFVASALLHILAGGWFLETTGDWSTPGGRNVLLSVCLGALAIGVDALVVTVPMIFIAERLGWRSPLYFAAMGLLTPLCTRSGLYLAGNGVRPVVLAWLAAGGVAGGLAYWLIAGRRSGQHRAAPAGEAA